MTDPADLGFDPERLARLPARLDADIAAGRYHGAALAVSRHGELVYRAVHGYADRAAGRPLTVDDAFVTFSVGKQFTNVVVLGRVENGDLWLDMPVCELLPEFGGRGLREIKLWHLLTHTSGIISAIPGVAPEVLTNISKLTAWVASQRPDALPGEVVNYSIIAAHSVMAEMVLRAEGHRRSFTELLREDLFEPLGMTHTCMGRRADLVERLCPVTTCYTEPGMFHPEEVLGVSQVVMVDGCEVPAGGYITCLDDLHRFSLMLRNGGELDGVRILSPRTLEYCTQNFTGERRNLLFDYARDLRGWAPWPASIGIGFFMRGEGVQPGPMSNFSSPLAFCGWGAGSTCFWVDPELDLTFSFLSTGLMEETYHIERLQRLADLVITSMVE
ncbi:MAG: beta-lactamase family protein [Gammaproteobacteria bacterium]|nr:beta-lactamase family protein [Gammaproteobacteria bacterium]MCP5198715.1 beta-lactamase family protein [Gammaproteobacteria bacterium]